MSRQVQFQVAPLTPVIKWILIVTVAIWFVGQVLLERFMGVNLTTYFALVPERVVEGFEVWRLFTYIFFHTADQPAAVTHILFNMLMLWFFGARLEQRWGSRYFAFFYLGSGVGAATIYCFGLIIHSLVTGMVTAKMVPVIGASGSVFGLLIAYGLIFKDEVIYFMGLFPMRAITFAALAGIIDFASMITSSVKGGGVAYLAHLGGLASGFILLKVRKYWVVYKEKEKARKKFKNLRLVVDNEKKPKSQQGPRYWN